MTPSVVEAQGVWLEYRSVARQHVVAIKGIDMTVAEGEFVGVLGPSGSGKSSLLFLLAGLRHATRGRVLFRGREWSADVSSTADTRREALGIVFSEPFLIPYLTVRENTLLQALPSTATTRIGQLAEALEIDHLLEERPGALSAGERQRASILRALVNAPSLVLADEPTAHLDRESGLRVVALLRQSVGRSSLVLASHDARMLAAADAVRQLDDGGISTATAS